MNIAEKIKQETGIDIDLDRDSLFDELGRRRLKDAYLRDDESSPQERYARVASKFSTTTEHAQRMYDYFSKHWLSPATPILSFGRDKNSQLPISCYLNYIEDTKEGLVENLAETMRMSMLGGGVGIHVDIRSCDKKSVGVVPHLGTYDKGSMAYKQGNRRGAFAAYLRVDHPDIMQFLEIRKPTGDINLRAPNIHHGVCLTDKFMEIIERRMVDPNASVDWELIQPNTGEVREVVSAIYIWERILELRMHTGEPYLFFIDTANKGVKDFQKKVGLKIHGSNLCTEIALPTNGNRSAVCCLMSPNAEYYDDWVKNDLMFKDALEFLDNVLSYFIGYAPETLSRAKFSAGMERSVGFGMLGLHSYFQSKMIPFESAMAKSLNIKIFKHVKEKLDQATYELALTRGPCPDADKFGVMVRNAYLMSVAPNASTSIIVGNTSPSIEPYAANAYKQDTESGSHFTRNKYLNDLIKKESLKHEDPELFCQEVWESIVEKSGSVQHIEWLTDYERDVFKTSDEIDQRWIIDLASDRQKFIDQAQSVNLFFRPDVSIKYLHAVHFMAWKKGLKSLYYCRSSKLRKVTNVTKEQDRRRIEEDFDMKSIIDDTACLACEG